MKYLYFSIKNLFYYTSFTCFGSNFLSFCVKKKRWRCLKITSPVCHQWLNWNELDLRKFSKINTRLTYTLVQKTRHSHTITQIYNFIAETLLNTTIRKQKVYKNRFVVVVLACLVGLFTDCLAVCLFFIVVGIVYVC